jgi:hypothetical protein
MSPFMVLGMMFGDALRLEGLCVIKNGNRSLDQNLLFIGKCTET